MSAAIELSGVGKTFTMHLQGGVRLSVVSGVTFSVQPGECVVLAGPSGTGKSSILKMIFGSYRGERGSILVRDGADWVDVARAEPRAILALRRNAIGYVTQFLRAVPRVAALDVVGEPLVSAGTAKDIARQQAADILRRLNIPGRCGGCRRRPSPAANSNASTSHAGSCRNFRFCCSTSRPHRSMLLTAPR
jgi:alpha-D-ribose 1-methylphosphonate 5-triphosphate synthase subunit PhnL